MTLETGLVTDIKNILQSARHKAYAAVNFAMVEAYWHIGRRIVREEQQGANRAGYGTYLVKELSKQLSRELGKGFSLANIKNFRQFYLAFPEDQKGYAVRSQLQEVDNKGNAKSYAAGSQFETGLPFTTLRKELTWTHYRMIMRVDNPKARQYYVNECAENNWSTRVLERNINTFYYERILSTRHNTGEIPTPENFDKQSPADFIKDPYIFEFLNLPQPYPINELDLETALIDNLKHFLLELGKGFCYIKRQFRINTETKNFYIDLVFYNYLLKCFVLIDLKSGELSHQDLGQMDMYIRMFDDLKRTDNDNPTIGVILCTDKDETFVKYSMLNGHEQLFATKYKMYLPTEQELIDEIEREKIRIYRQLEEQKV